MIIFLLFAHWVGDFVFQSHWQASNKHNNPYALTWHVSMYVIPIAIASLFIFTFESALEFVVLNYAIHWLIDWRTSKITNRLFWAKRTHDFFVVIGFDQFLHASTLLLTYEWLT